MQPRSPRRLLVVLILAASGLIWTIMAYARVPDVALGLGSDGIKGSLMPTDHGMPIWAVGLCWMSLGVFGMASAASRRIENFERTHAVACLFLAVLYLVLVARFTWL